MRYYCDRQGCLDLPDGCELRACSRHQMFPEDTLSLGVFFHQHLVKEVE